MINDPNEVVHPVESQWHFKYLTKYGYIPLTKSDKGFVRTYTYQHPTTGRIIICNTGVNADYWRDPSTTDGGYWSELEPYLQSVI